MSGPGSILLFVTGAALLGLLLLRPTLAVASINQLGQLVSNGLRVASK